MTDARPAMAGNVIDLYERRADACDRERGHLVEDPDCGGHAVWLATYRAADN